MNNDLNIKNTTFELFKIVNIIIQSLISPGIFLKPVINETIFLSDSHLIQSAADTLFLDLSNLGEVLGQSELYLGEDSLENALRIIRALGLSDDGNHMVVRLTTILDNVASFSADINLVIGNFKREYFDLLYLGEPIDDDDNGYLLITKGSVEARSFELSFSCENINSPKIIINLISTKGF